MSSKLFWVCSYLSILLQYPDIPPNAHPESGQIPQRIARLRANSYSESGGSSGYGSSPFSQPLDYDGASHRLELLADQASFASALDLTYRRPKQQATYHHGSVASNFEYETDAFSKSQPLGIPPKQGYGHAYNHHDCWQSDYPTKVDYVSPPNIDHYERNEPTIKNYDNNYDDDEESLLVVDSGSSWSDDNQETMEGR